VFRQQSLSGSWLYCDSRTNIYNSLVVFNVETLKQSRQFSHALLSEQVHKGKELNDLLEKSPRYGYFLKSDVRLPRDTRHLSYESDDQYCLSQQYMVLHKYHMFRMETRENLHSSPSGATPIIYILIFTLNYDIKKIKIFSSCV